MQRYLEMTPPLANKIILLINTSPLLKELWEQTIERESGMLNVQEQPKNKQQKAKGRHYTTKIRMVVKTIQNLVSVHKIFFIFLPSFYYSSVKSSTIYNKH